MHELQKNAGHYRHGIPLNILISDQPSLALPGNRGCQNYEQPAISAKEGKCCKFSAFIACMLSQSPVRSCSILIKELLSTPAYLNTRTVKRVFSRTA
ncbi:hypothetical protein [Arachidicoccus rhizosphaerae]|uniref:hypothetical protein n=1 Tax=Arachidicoccus rhizosphaerae TaxID=551991 RepID=UPI000B85A8B3|nr:hypothetical protein [Arachidicoccus rhizosphaerae]